MSASWSTPIDSYCERVDPTLLSEPMNLATNLAFIAASILAWRYARRRGVTHDSSLMILIAWITVVGVGSALFHSFATYWTMWADVVPIGIFVIGALLYFLRKVLGWSHWQVGGGLALFVVANAAGLQVPSDWVNGSNGYFGAFAALITLSILARKDHPAAGRRLLGASLAFAVSVTFRSIDLEVCESIPIGTHFLWHSLNGVVLYLIGTAALEGRYPVTAVPRLCGSHV